MDTTTHLRDALRRVHGEAQQAARSVRASELRAALHSIAAQTERALAPIEPTAIELRQALQDLSRHAAPATKHPSGCGCPYCVAISLLR